MSTCVGTVHVHAPQGSEEGVRSPCSCESLTGVAGYQPPFLLTIEQFSSLQPTFGDRVFQWTRSWLFAVGRLASLPQACLSLTCSAGGVKSYIPRPGFYMGAGTWTQVLLPSQQVLWLLGHISSALINFLSLCSQQGKDLYKENYRENAWT